MCKRRQWLNSKICSEAPFCCNPSSFAYATPSLSGSVICRTCIDEATIIKGHRPMSAKMLQSGALDTTQSTLSSWQLYVVTFLAEVFCVFQHLCSAACDECVFKRFFQVCRCMNYLYNIAIKIHIFFFKWCVARIELNT